MLFLKFERLLKGRDSRKIGNNTWLRVIQNRAGSVIGVALRHFSTDLIHAHSTGRVTVWPYYSVTSMRRLREYIAGLWQERGLVHYRDPNGTVHRANARLVLRADGFVEETDYVPPPPPPAWKNKRLAAATIRAVMADSFDAWAARPVLGCACCRAWQHAQIVTPLVGADLWAAFTERSARVTAKCLWHNGMLDSDAQVFVARRVLRDVPLAQRPGVLKRVRGAFVRAATAHYVAALAA